MPQMTCTFGSDRLNGAKVEKRDGQPTDTQTFILIGFMNLGAKIQIIKLLVCSLLLSTLSTRESLRRQRIQIIERLLIFARKFKLSI